MRNDLQVRDAGPADVEAVAKLHAASWRSAYRGILRAVYLDGSLDEDRRGLWQARLNGFEAQRITILAEQDGALVGFGCLLLDADPRWGSLIDNLHADPTSRRRGIGRRLMRAMAARSAATRPGRPLHLFCMEANEAARGFYERLGGAIVGREIHDEPDGCRHPCLRYAWSSSAELLDALG